MRRVVVVLLAAACAPSSNPDGGPCELPICESVPPGCARVNADACSCGTLVCGDAGLVDDDAGFADAGPPPVDDAGATTTDAGATTNDAGLTPVDGGDFPYDAGLTTDAGNATTDAGNASTDAGNAPADAGNAPADAGFPDAGPWRDAITVDGINDFVVATERIATTSTGFFVYATWDDAALYLGYEGADIDDDDLHKWVQIYIDEDPGMTTGALTGLRYNTEEPAFPTGFGAEVHIQRDTRASGAYLGVKRFTSSWSDVASPGVVVARAGTLMEFSIPWATLNDAPSVGVVAFMMNETDLNEGTYGGIYAGSFTDGYYDATADAGPMRVPITKYLLVDRATAAAPNDDARRRP